MDSSDAIHRDAIHRDAIPGRYFVAGRSAAADCTVESKGGRCLVRDDDGMVLADYPLGDIVYAHPMASNPWRFEFPDGTSFETGEHRLVEAWLAAHAPNCRHWAHRLENSWKWALAALAVLPLLMLLFVFQIMPRAADLAARQIPGPVLDQLDRQVLANLDSQWLGESGADPAQHRRLEAAWSALGEPPDLRLVLRDGNAMGANAFALPGGTLVVTDQLLELMENREELIAVLAHETGHVRGRHGVRNLIQTLGVAALLATVVGDVSGLAESLLVTGPAMLQQLRYSREFEAEADEFARARLRSLDITGACLGSSLSRLMNARRGPVSENPEPKACPSPEAPEDRPRGEPPGWFDYLSTHPAIEERIRLSGGTGCP